MELFSLPEEFSGMSA